MGLFEKMAEKMKNSNSVVFLFIVFGAGLWVGATMWMEDYRTTLEGYKALPTLKTAEVSFTAVALAPQLGQIIFFYYYMQDTSRRWALLLTGALALTDWFTDVYYKSGAGLGKATFETVLIAGGESFFIYEVMSELLVAVCLGVLVDLAKPTGKRIAYWLFPALKEQKPEQKKEGGDQKNGGDNKGNGQHGNNNQQGKNNGGGGQQNGKGNGGGGGGNNQQQPQKQKENHPNGQGKSGPYVLNPDEIRRIMEDK